MVCVYHSLWLFGFLFGVRGQMQKFYYDSVANDPIKSPFIQQQQQQQQQLKHFPNNGYYPSNGFESLLEPDADTVNFQTVTDTPEVALARQQHLATYEAVLRGDYTSSPILPQPVRDTPEVAAAKREFFARYTAELERHRYHAALLQTTAARNGDYSMAASIPGFRVPHTLLPTHADSFKRFAPSKVYLTTYGYHLASPINWQQLILPMS